MVCWWGTLLNLPLFLRDICGELWCVAKGYVVRKKKLKAAEDYHSQLSRFCLPFKRKKKDYFRLIELFVHLVLLPFFVLYTLWGTLWKPCMQTVLILTLVLFLYFQFKEDICLISESFLIVPQSQTKYKLSLWAAQIVWISWMYWCTAIDTVLSSTTHCGAQQKWRWNEKCVILWNIILQNQDLLEWTPRLNSLLKREKLYLSQHIQVPKHFLFLAKIKHCKEIC